MVTCWGRNDLVISEPKLKCRTYYGFKEKVVKGSVWMYKLILELYMRPILM